MPPPGQVEAQKERPAPFLQMSLFHRTEASHQPGFGTGSDYISFLSFFENFPLSTKANYTAASL
jgi:hypothetical protein